MIKVLWLLFVVLLAYAHLANVDGDAYHRPLSQFRDFQPNWIGHVLFGVLLLFGAEVVRNAFRVNAATDGVAYLFVAALLSIVAITPSDDGLHGLCAFLSMLTLHFYFAALLYHKDLYCLFAMHLVIPVAILVATKAQSYGIWQKSMILYFLSATVIQQHFWRRSASLWSLTAAVMQHSISTGWLHRSKPAWLRELVEGIEWSRKPSLNPDVTVRQKTKRRTSGNISVKGSSDRPNRYGSRFPKLQPLDCDHFDELK